MFLIYLFWLIPSLQVDCCQYLPLVSCCNAPDNSLIVNKSNKLIHLHISSESIAKNVALYRSGTFCSSSASEELFDGDKNFSQPSVLNGTFTCETNGVLEIDLGGMFNIHYVIIYEGKGQSVDL